jgi:RNA polymerase primary sigma factor
MEEMKVNSGSSAVNLYMQKINLVDRLTPEQERELGLKAKAGDKEAQEKLVEANLKLCVYVAKKYHPNTSQEFLDLIQEGNLGLMKAAAKFDPDTGNKFSTYAVYWIRQAISNSINNCSRTVRLPAHVQSIITEITKAQDDLEEKNGVAPTLEQLANATGYSTDELLMYQNANNTILSLDYVIDDESDTETLDLVADPEVTDPAALLKQDEKKQDLLKILDTLSPVEKEVIILRYGLDDGECKSLEEIGKRVHMGRDKVRQIEIKSMRKLRSPFREDALREVLNAY